MSLCNACFAVIAASLADVLDTGVMRAHDAPHGHEALQLDGEFRQLGQLVRVVADAGPPGDTRTAAMAEADRRLVAIYRDSTPLDTIGLVVTLDHLIEALALVRTTAERAVAVGSNIDAAELADWTAARRLALIEQVRRMVGMAGGQTEVVEVPAPGRAPSAFNPSGVD